MRLEMWGAHRKSGLLSKVARLRVLVPDDLGHAGQAAGNHGYASRQGLEPGEVVRIRINHEDHEHHGDHGDHRDHGDHDADDD